MRITKVCVFSSILLYALSCRQNEALAVTKPDRILKGKANNDVREITVNSDTELKNAIESCVEKSCKITLDGEVFDFPQVILPYTREITKVTTIEFYGTPLKSPEMYECGLTPEVLKTYENKTFSKGFYHTDYCLPPGKRLTNTVLNCFSKNLVYGYFHIAFFDVSMQMNEGTVTGPKYWSSDTSSIRFSRCVIFGLSLGVIRTEKYFRYGRLIFAERTDVDIRDSIVSNTAIQVGNSDEDVNKGFFEANKNISIVNTVMWMRAMTGDSRNIHTEQLLVYKLMKEIVNCSFLEGGKSNYDFDYDFDRWRLGESYVGRQPARIIVNGGRIERIVNTSFKHYWMPNIIEVRGDERAWDPILGIGTIDSCEFSEIGYLDGFLDGGESYARIFGHYRMPNGKQVYPWYRNWDGKYAKEIGDTTNGIIGVVQGGKIMSIKNSHFRDIAAFNYDWDEATFRDEARVWFPSFQRTGIVIERVEGNVYAIEFNTFENINAFQANTGTIFMGYPSIKDEVIKSSDCSYGQGIISDTGNVGRNTFRHNSFLSCNNCTNEETLPKKLASIFDVLYSGSRKPTEIGIGSTSDAHCGTCPRFGTHNYYHCNLLAPCGPSPDCCNDDDTGITCPISVKEWRGIYPYGDDLDMLPATLPPTRAPTSNMAPGRIGGSALLLIAAVQTFFIAF